MGEEGVAGVGLSSKDDTEVLVGDDIVAGMKARRTRRRRREDEGLIVNHLKNLIGPRWLRLFGDDVD